MNWLKLTESRNVKALECPYFFDGKTNDIKSQKADFYSNNFSLIEDYCIVNKFGFY